MFDAFAIVTFYGDVWSPIAAVAQRHPSPGVMLLLGHDLKPAKFPRQRLWSSGSVSLSERKGSRNSRKKPY